MQPHHDSDNTNNTHNSDNSFDPVGTRPRRRARWLAVGLGGIVALGAAGTAVAQQIVEQDTPITGPALAAASAAALAHTGEGRVTGTEVGDEDSYYEVEVTLDSGAQVDIQLDEQFIVVDATADVEDAGEPGSAG